MQCSPIIATLLTAARVPVAPRLSTEVSFISYQCGGIAIYSSISDIINIIHGAAFALFHIFVTVLKNTLMVLE